MKLYKTCFILLIACLYLTYLPPKAYSEQTGIHWYSYEDGIKKIKAESKKGFLHFYTNWCTFCKLMNVNTFTDAKVVAFLNENFVPIRVNADDDKEVAQKYSVNRFPNNFFIADDTSTVGNRPGYIPADILLDMLIYVQTNSYKTMTFNDYVEKKQAKKDFPPPDPNM